METLEGLLQTNKGVVITLVLQEIPAVADIAEKILDAISDVGLDVAYNIISGVAIT